MYTVQTQHKRDALGRVCRACVDDCGLGLTITVTPKFDPVRMAAREAYWFQQIVDDLASQYRQAGYVGGLAGLGFSFFGFGKKPSAPSIPWGEIYATARPLAHQYAIDEENARIAQEPMMIEQQRQTEATSRSVTASSFQLPEGVQSVSKGALVLAPVGSPKETRKK